MKLTYVILKFELYSLSNSKLLEFYYVVIYIFLFATQSSCFIFNSSILLSNNTFL